MQDNEIGVSMIGERGGGGGGFKDGSIMVK